MCNYSIWQNTEPLFKSSLNAMLKAYGHEDYLALADVMEEELVESLQSWQKFVEKLAKLFSLENLMTNY